VIAARTLNHADVVGAVADRQRDCPFVTLDQLHDLRFLARSDAAADDRLTHTARFQQLSLHLFLQRVFLATRFNRLLEEPLQFRS